MPIDFNKVKGQSRHLLITRSSHSQGPMSECSISLRVQTFSDGSCQCGLAVVHVPNGTHVDMRLLSYKHISSVPLHTHTGSDESRGSQRPPTEGAGSETMALQEN